MFEFDEFEKKLAERYKFMRVPEYDSWQDAAKRNLYHAFGLEINEGWHQLIWDMCGEIEAALVEYDLKPEDIIVEQVKSKFGELRFYYALYAHGNDSAYEAIENIVDKYEDKSCKTCEICGKPGKNICDHGWYITVCEDCGKEN